MTCRCGRDAGHPPYEIADVMAFADQPPPDRQQPAADGSDDMGDEDDHRAAAVSATPSRDYRFAWSG